MTQHRLPQSPHQVKRNGGKYPWKKYVYLLCCLSLLTISWTSARYITALDASRDAARVAMWQYEITVATDRNAQYFYLNNSSELASRDLGLTLYEFYSQQYTDGNQRSTFEPASSESDTNQVVITFTIKYATEVAAKFFIEKNYSNLTSLEAAQSQVVSVSYTGLPAGAVQQSQGSMPEDAYVDVAPSSGSFTCTVVVSHGSLNAERSHFVSIIPTFQQID